MLLGAFLDAGFCRGAEPITLVPREAVWKFFSNDELTPDWKNNDYNPWFWLEGPGPFGYGEGDERTLIYDDSLDSAPITIYLRTTFVVTNRAQLYYLTLRFVADDGVVLYLNGQELHRHNLPAGPIYFETEALTNLETNENRVKQLGLYAYALQPGTNFLCAELHQTVAGRMDGSFELELLANLPLGRPVPTITSPAERAHFNAGPVPLEVSYTDPSAGVRQVLYYTNGEYLGAVNAEPFSMLWTNPPKGGHKITAVAVNNFFVPGESAPVNIYVGRPIEPRLVSGPYLQSGSATGMVVRWRTDWFSDAVVRYGTNAGELVHSVTNRDEVFDHEVQLAGLQPDMRYFYSIGSTTQPLRSGPEFFFRTSPTNTRPVRLWVLGDSGSADLPAARVRDAYYAFNGSPTADLLLMLGDNAYGSGTDAQYQKAVFQFYPDLLRNTVVWPTMGNHDADENASHFRANGGPYLDLFTLPRMGECGGVASGSELYYSFDFANIHFICLDSFVTERLTNGAMLTWLEQDLAATDKDWIIAFWHHPPYTWGTHNSDGEGELADTREKFLPVLENYGVDLVLCGHSHVYERSFLLNGHYGHSSTLQSSMILDGGFGQVGSGGPYRKPSGGLGANRGTVYTVCGCSGEGNQREDLPLHPAMALNHGGYGSMVIDVDGLQLTARFLRPSQTVEDEFTIDKSAPTSFRPLLSVKREAEGLSLRWPTSNPSYGLEQTPWLPGLEWQEVSQVPRRMGRQHVVTLPPTNAAGFFRLRTP